MAVDREGLSEFANMQLKDKLISCINLFEAYLIERNLDQSEWIRVLQILKEINDFQYLDEWFYKYCEILPDSVLGENFFEENNDDWEFLNLQDFQMLKKLYSNSEETKRISELMILIHEIGSIELYSDSKKLSKLSIVPYSKFVDLVKK